MPPPPPLPPPLPFGKKSTGQGGKVNSSSPAPDRNALLSQIKKGANLKRVQTNDRSAPLISSSASKAPPSPSAGNGICRANGPSPLIPPGGLFAHGMPKLRPTGSKLGDSGHVSDNSLGVSFNRTDDGCSRSHPPSPASKSRQPSSFNCTLSESVGNKNFPNDLNLKGPAPAPPSSNMKPFILDFAAPNRHPTVRRSVSQTSLGPKVRPARPPPGVRPPPPPKSTAALQGASGPPALPSKPPNVRRRQSFGVNDVHLSASFENARLSGKSLTAPPPPPRNNSVPNSLDSVPNSSPTTTHVSRMTIAPPPPPLRPSNVVSRAPSMRPPEPPTRPPCLPPHMTYPVPPSQMKAVPSHSAAPPPPPTRVSSVVSSQSVEPISDFEVRFFHKFHGLNSLPPPPKFRDCPKVYSSQFHRDKSLRRQPPPPPPPVGSLASGRQSGQHIGHQPVLHIQLQSRVFVNNTAHC